MGALKPWHIIVLVVVLILLFGAKRLPDAARSLGRSLRIIKAETKGLVDDDDVAEKAEPPYARQPLHPTEIHPGQPAAPYPPQGYQQQPGYQAPQPGYQAPQPGYQAQPGYAAPGAPQQPYGQQPPPAPPYADPTAQPYVDPSVQRTNDR